MITQRLHALGDWTLGLENLSAALMERLTIDEDHAQTLGGATLVITPSRTDPDALGNADTGTAFHPLFDLAAYTGTVTGLTGDRDEISGRSTAYWLGTDDDTGEMFVGSDMANLTRTARTFLLDSDEWLDWMVNGGGYLDVTATNVNLRSSGLYGDDYASTPVANVPYFPEMLTRRELLSRVCDYIGEVWYVDPQMVVHMGEAADLFPDSPRAIIAENLDSDPSWWTISSPSIEVEESLSGYANKVASFNSSVSPPTSWAYPNSGTPSAHFYRPDGTAAHIVQQEDAINEETSGDYATRAATIVSRRDTIRRAITIEGSVHAHGAHLIPGEPVYVFDPTQNLVDTANEAHVAGRVIHPMAVELQAVTWPVVKGMGVYVVYWDKTAAELAHLDLSDFVVYEDGSPTNLEVGASSIPL